MSLLLRLSLLGVLLAGPLSAGGNPWAQLKTGMLPQEAVRLLGDPILRRHGKGFETWTYDQGAEVLLYGGVVMGWTAPASADLSARSAGVWGSRPSAQYYATLYSLLQSPGVIPRTSDVLSKKPAVTPAPAGNGDEYHFPQRKG